MILSFQTDMPGQTMQTPSLIRVYTICHSVCIVWTHFSMVEPHSPNFRVITTNVLGVRIFRKFTVVLCEINFMKIRHKIMVPFTKPIWSEPNPYRTTVRTKFGYVNGTFRYQKFGPDQSGTCSCARTEVR